MLGPISALAVSGAIFNNLLSVLFGGSGENVTMGNVHGFLRTDPFSFSFWFKSTGPTSSGTFLSKRGSSSDPGYEIFLSTSSGRIEVNIANTDSLEIDLETSTGGFDDGVWRNVVVTYDGGSIAAGVRIYMNAVSQALTVNQDTLGANSIVNARDFKLGVKGTATNPYGGNEDEVSVWDIALSGPQVTEIYGPGIPSDLALHSAFANNVGWWRMGDGDTFPILLDSSVNSNSGTMTNGMVVGDIVADVPP